MYWSFSFSISLCNKYSGLISFRIDCFDFLAVKGSLKSLLQHCRLKASILWCSALFMVQLSHLYLTTGKCIALTIQSLAGEAISLLFNTLSTFSSIVYKGSLFLSVASICISCLFDASHSNRCEMISHCGFDLLSLMISNVGHLFMYLLAICLHLLWKNFLFSFPFLKNQIYLFCC